MGRSKARLASLIFLLVSILAVNWGRLTASGPLPREAVALASEPAPRIAPRAAPGGNTGPGNCAECRAMLLRLPQGTLDPQAHRFACGTCHHPHESRKSADGWRATCTTSECHPRAWNESRFHRLDPEVFKTCTNCHRPHIWKADGEDCRGCHALPPGSSAAAPRAPAPASAAHAREAWSHQDLSPGVPLAVAAMDSFPHAAHARYDCATCHDSSVKHGTLKLSPPGDCLACHHGPPAVAECATCHAAGQTEQILKRTVSMRLAGSAPPRARSLGFDHGLHQSLGCATCHTPPYERPPQIDCTGCHASHHRPEANCTACHETPSPAAHPMSLHETGCAAAGCHATDHSAGPLLTGRKLCLTCHTGQTEHQPGRDCAGCHLVTFGHGPEGGKP